MHIHIYKFGSMLVSRPAGKEAFLAYQPLLKHLSPNEKIVVDFAEVKVLTPSWADEFLSPLLDQFGDRLILLPSDNLSVHATLKILQEVNKKPFKIR